MEAGKKRKKFKLTLIQKRALTGLLFISPWLLGFLLFYVRSIVQLIYFSVSEITIADGGNTGYVTKFVGFDNFKYLFTVNGTFNQDLVTSVGDVYVDVFLIIFFSLFMAILLNQKFKGRTVARAIFFLPVLMGSPAIADAIATARTAMIGGISANSAAIASEAATATDLTAYATSLVNFGVPITLVTYVVTAVGRIADVISASGVQIVIFLAALQSVPSSLYEVSKIEGATSYETFWKVTFPMVMPHIITCVVYTVVESFMKSDIVESAYQMAFGATHSYGYSSAMSLVSTVVVTVLLLIIVNLIQKKTFYYN